MSDRVLVTRPISAEGMSLLEEAGLDVKLVDAGRPITRSEIMGALQGCKVLLCLLTDIIDGEVMDSVPGLRLISNCAAGYDNIDVAAATTRGIPVLNTPGSLTDATADIAWALLLGAARMIPASDRYVREGKFTGWDPMLFLGHPLAGKTIGIVGAGRIGQAVAKRALAFGMKIVYHNRSPRPEMEREMGAKKLGLDELLRCSDVVSIHTPLTSETRGIIGKKEFSLMKPTAILINTARGPCVIEQDLVDALRIGEIAAAGLDVYEEEPKVHPGLLELENVVMTPHTGSAIPETRASMAMMAAEGVVDFLAGRRPKHVVNPEVL